MSGAGRGPRRIVYMVTAQETAATFLPGLLRHFADEGFAVTVVADGGPRLEALRGPGIAPVAIRMRRDPSPLHDLRSLAACVALLRRERPEVLVAATPKAALIGMLAGWFTRVPQRQHQVWGLRYETERGARRFVLLMMERLTMLLATDVVCNSPSLADEVRKIARVQPRVLGYGSSHGVDLEHFDRSRPEIHDGTDEKLRRGSAEGIVLGFVGRLHKDKGVGTLLDALPLLKIDRPVTVVLVGPDEDPDIAERLRMPMEGVSLVSVGAVSDTRPWFAAMDVHILPTLREGFPNVVLEASAMGVPTITTTATGARDSVVPEVTGVLVPPEDPVALAAAIERLADNPKLRRTLGENARRIVSERFAQDVVWTLQRKSLDERHPSRRRRVRTRWAVTACRRRWSAQDPS